MINVCAIGAILAAVCGCSDGRPARVAVSGQVLIDDKPLSYGTVQFIPTGARASQGVIDKDGRFTLTCFGDTDGAVPGQHRVAVLAGEPISSTKILWHAPKKYLDPKTSGLTQEILGENNQVVIHLSWEGGREFIENTDGEIEGGPPGRRRK
jgi:hypothetical protein